jgi:hypothetical protein
MGTPREKAKGKAIEDELATVRASLDQLVKKAEEEGVDITRKTTEALTEDLTTLRILEEEANKLKNSRLIGAVRKERDRCRVALGLTVPKRRR